MPFFIIILPQGLSEWQLNSYYAAGRVMVPALLDIFTCQGFFKRQALLDLLTELAGVCVGCEKRGAVVQYTCVCVCVCKQQVLLPIVLQSTW